MSQPDSQPELTSWTEIGERTGLSSVHAKRIGDRALAKLRHALSATHQSEDWLREEFNLATVSEERYLALFLLSLAELKADD